MNYLGLDEKKTVNTVKELNVLLADYHLYYQKLRNFHWNVMGKNFFDLHVKFEELYEDAKTKVDEIAERVLTLRFQPTSNLSDYMEISSVKESPSNLSDSDMIKTLLNDHGILLIQLRKVSEIAEKGGDDGTIDLMGGYIRELEKTSWMLDAWKMKANESLKPA